MAVLQTGQSFNSGDQVTSQKLMDIANLATFDDPADGSTIIVNSNTYGVPGGDGKLKVKAGGISANELADDSVITAKIQDGAVTADKLDSAAVSVLMPSGTVLPFAGSALPGNPNDYLFCNGAAVSRSTYSTLFTAIGITYGVGNGSTTFNLPDLRGRVIAGQDNMGGTSANTLTDAQADQLGGTLGAEDHTLSISEIPSHRHPPHENITGITGGFVYNTNAGSGAGNGGGFEYESDTGLAGGGGAHNNVQPTIILNYIIKT